MEYGFLKLSRKFFSNELWKEARKFSECEAWIDLLQAARFDATGMATSELIGGREISYNRGQYPASISFLVQRWQWSDKKVRYFLDKLRRNGMITTSHEQGMNVITICKYDEYNATPEDAGGKQEDIAKSQEIKELYTALGELRAELCQTIEKMGQAGGEKKKKDKKNLSDRESTPIETMPPATDAAHAATLARREKFYALLVPYVDRYGKEMIRSFFNYWSELNKSGTKMRFELEKTWELSRRLSTWAARERCPRSASTQSMILSNNSPDKFNEKW